MAELKLDVPFFLQISPLNCGPSALRMVLSYFDKDPGIEILEERTGIKENKGALTIQIAKAAALSGYETEFFSKSIAFNKENLKLDFYQKYFDFASDSDKMVAEAMKAGVLVEEKTFPLGEILSKTGENCIPITLLDWGKINGTDKYHGHFVPIVGYDDENVIVHNHGKIKPEKFMKINRYLFESARKAKGTDEDIVFIHNEGINKDG